MLSGTAQVWKKATMQRFRLFLLQRLSILDFAISARVRSVALPPSLPSASPQ